MPGDTVKMEVFAKYLAPGDKWGANINTLLAAITNGTADPGTFVDGGATGNTEDLPNPYASLLEKDDEGTGPKAYLNYVERLTGGTIGGKTHGIKLVNYRTALQRLWSNATLSDSDRGIVKFLLTDIQNALSGY